MSPVETGSGTVGKSALQGQGRQVLAALHLRAALRCSLLLRVGFVHLIPCRLCDGVPAARSIPASVSLRLPAGPRPQAFGLPTRLRALALGAEFGGGGDTPPPHPRH